ncbi:MAG: methyltransferase domain-containing protein [Saprospiraceae bacterium]|nr:methyltransferase domain-containing protein [Saprospiraceae bacterium]MCB9323866.1 methyltransferase domain-containing protein [Lewinellaceae bacterium]
MTNAEKQIMTSLAWFRTRYALFLDLDLNRPANKENIESFGQAWIGDFKDDWSGAFESLIEKDILALKEEEYVFTEKGEKLSKEVEAEIPFFRYEYDNFFNLEQKSEAHKQFCREVYGMDLAQHGLIDADELSFLVEKLKTAGPQSILDIGCGNGKITEHLSSEIEGHFTGMDISNEAIILANHRTRNSEKLHFEVGNMNHLNLPQKYDAILFLDTLYYADNMEALLKTCLSALNENGKIYAYFSQWIMDREYSEYLAPENTGLARVLKNLPADYDYVDLTASGLRHWKRKLEVLEKMKPAFLEENNEALWQYRYREANRYANWGDDKYSRYLYEVKNS